MKERPLVSIITPSFNQAAYLEATIESVLGQDYPRLEYLVVDGGSNDGSADIIRKYSNRLAYWVSEPDRGQADAINKGFERAKGEYLCYLNSDDLFYPGFISERMRQFAENPAAGLIYGDVDQGSVPGETWLRKGRSTDWKEMILSLDVPVPQQSAIWKRKVFEDAGPFNVHLDVLLDRDFFIRAAKDHSLLYIPGSLSFFRVHKDSKSVAGAKKWSRELPVYYEGLIREFGDYRKYRHRVMSRCYWLCSNVSLEAGDRKAAAGFRFRSFCKHPFIFARLRLIQLLVKLKHLLR